MTPEEHLAEADRLIADAEASVGDYAELLTFAQFHIQIAHAAAAVGMRGDLGRFVDLTEADTERTLRAARAAAEQ